MQNTKLIYALFFVYLFLAGCSLINRPLGANDNQIKLWQDIKGKELYCLGQCYLYNNHDSAIYTNDKKIINNLEGYIPFDIKICNDNDCEIYIKKAPLNKPLWLLKIHEADGRILLSDINNGKYGSWDDKNISDQFNKKLKEEQNKIELKNKEKQKTFQKWLDNISKKNKKKWCQPIGIMDMLFEGKIQRDCLFFSDGPNWQVVQQIKEGTIVSPNWTDRVFLIEYNNIDYNLYDNELIKAGIFINTGKFQYTNLLGINKTIPKLRRIETIDN